jgi:hypothetical protein
MTFAVVVCLLFSLSTAPLARAQAVPAVESVSTKLPDIHITPVMGLNISVDYEAQYNSATQWANIISPDISFRFNRRLSVDASVPWYATVNANIRTTRAGVTSYPLKPGRDLLGDASAAAHLEFQPHKSLYLLTPTVAFPTGNSRYGLSADATTYNITGHAEHEIGVFTPELEAGFGNSSSLANQTVHKAYTAVGSMANFELGTSIDLPLNLDVVVEAYEDLPVGAQNVYGTITKRHGHGKGVTTQVLQGAGVAEDNGFNAEVDLPVGHHILIDSSYEHSLIQGVDIASVGVIFTLRSPKIPVIR